jgi:hypothetical protein
MRILATTFAYNERKYIEQWVNYYRSQGCELYVLDNMSTDGTYEWLVENKVPCAQVDTGKAFHLHKLQDELMWDLEIIKPDWVVYNGIDLFTVTEKKLCDTLKELDDQGYNQLQLPCYNVFNTGEEFGTPLQKHFTRGGLYRNLIMTAKYEKGFNIRNDNLGIENENPRRVAGYMFNYGGCKPAQEQEEKLQRREKAWSEGLPSNVGKHFRAGRARGWVYGKDETEDLSIEPFWKYIEKTICM